MSKWSSTAQAKHDVEREKRWRFVEIVERAITRSATVKIAMKFDFLGRGGGDVLALGRITSEGKLVKKISGIPCNIEVLYTTAKLVNGCTAARACDHMRDALSNKRVAQWVADGQEFWLFVYPEYQDRQDGDVEPERIPYQDFAMELKARTGTKPGGKPENG